MNISKILAGAAMVAALGTAAHATTYVGTRDVAGATVNLSVTTDGAIGVLTQSDVTDWTIGLTDSAGSFTLTSSNSEFLDIGSGLSATSTGLYFDFGSGGIALWENSVIGDDGPFYCLTSNNCWGNSGAAEGVSTQSPESPIEGVPQSGNQLLARAGAVPEPATWAMMLVGVGGLGMSLRGNRRKAAVATA